MPFRSHKIGLWIVFGLSALSLSLGAQMASGGEGEEGEQKTAPAGGVNQRDFLRLNARLNSLSTRIAEAEKQFEELIRAKSAAKVTEEKQRLIKMMVEVANDRNKAVDEFNKVKSDLSLKFPNQGEQLDRRYQLQSKKSSEELEGAAGLDELLTRIKKIVEKKFAPIVEAEDKHAQKAQLTQIAKPKTEETEQKLRLER